MWKRFLRIAVVLATTQLPIPCQAPGQQKENQDHNRTNQAAANPTLYPISPATTGKSKGTSAPEKLGYWRVAFGPEYFSTWALVVIGGIAGGLAFCTLRRIGDQAVSGRDAANAALLNAEAVIKSERPWLLVNVEPKKDRRDEYSLQAFNAGRTPAEFHEGHLALAKHPVGFTEPPVDFQAPFSLPMQNLIVSRDSFEIQPVFPEALVTEEERDGFSTQVLYVYGRISYWDTFTDRNSPGAKPYVTQWIFQYIPSRRGFFRCAGGYTKNS